MAPVGARREHRLVVPRDVAAGAPVDDDGVGGPDEQRATPHVDARTRNGHRAGPELGLRRRPERRVGEHRRHDGVAGEVGRHDLHEAFEVVCDVLVSARDRPIALIEWLEDAIEKVGTHTSAVREYLGWSEILAREDDLNLTTSQRNQATERRTSLLSMTSATMTGRNRNRFITSPFGTSAVASCC